MKRVNNNQDALDELKKGNDVWLDEREDKCLVEEARKKCTCEFCNFNRALIESAKESYVTHLVNLALIESLNEAMYPNKQNIYKE